MMRSMWWTGLVGVALVAGACSSAETGNANTTVSTTVEAGDAESEPASGGSDESAADTVVVDTAPPETSVDTSAVDSAVQTSTVETSSVPSVPTVTDGPDVDDTGTAPSTDVPVSYDPLPADDCAQLIELYETVDEAEDDEIDLVLESIARMRDLTPDEIDATLDLILDAFAKLEALSEETGIPIDSLFESEEQEEEVTEILTDEVLFSGERLMDFLASACGYDPDGEGI